MENFVDSLLEKKVLISAGTGGVGKTSTSAALGILAAQKGLNTLVLTIDPAKRLKTALGLDNLNDHNSIVEVKLERPMKGKLYAGVVNAKAVFDDFVTEASPDAESANQLLNNLLYKKLSMGLQGSQEFTSLQMFYKAYESNEYDLIIVDTPPAQHALDFLEAPERLSKLFDEKILKWFVSEKEGSFGFIKKAIRTGTRKAFSILEKLTGDQFVDEIFDFFVSMKFIRSALVTRNQQIARLLHSKEVGFLLITAYDVKKLKHAIEFNGKLQDLGFSLAAVLVNRCFPAEDSLYLSSAKNEKQQYYHELKDYYKKEEASIEKINDEFPQGIPVFKLMEVISSTDPLKTVEEMAQQFPWRI
ncbi:MAG: hypothetical protein CL674_03925 [Bdellovibrionaceae bacterium]|nr:hypothetical protein [Pseudobdellovibrionaceae bacterium]